MNENVDLHTSNSLADQSARIQAEHRATSAALKSSLEHAMTAGDLLIEAKALVPHGQWLPWLAEHCEMAERTAQLHMRTAKNRDGIELQIRNDVADLTLNEAAALMFLSSDVKKLFAFTKQLEGVTDPEDVLKICMENGFGVFHAPDPFAEMTKPEILEWHVWMLWLAHSGMPVDGTAAAMDWCLRGGLKTVTEYYDWRARGGCWWDRSTPEELAETIQEWHTFKATKSNLSLEMIVEELNALAAQDAARPSKPRRHKTRRRRAA